MVADSGNATYKTEAVAIEEVVALEEEDVLSIHITPTTPGTVFISEKCIGILALQIGMLIGETVKNMLAANTAVQSLVADTVMAVHGGKWPW